MTLQTELIADRQATKINVISAVIGKTVRDELRDISNKMPEYVENPSRVKLSQKFQKLLNVFDVVGLYGMREYLAEMYAVALIIEDESVIMPRDLLIKRAKVVHRSIGELGGYCKALSNGDLYKSKETQKLYVELCSLTGNETKGRQFAVVFPSLELNIDKRLFEQQHYDLLSTKIGLILSAESSEERSVFAEQLKNLTSGTEMVGYFDVLERLLNFTPSFVEYKTQEAWKLVKADLEALAIDLSKDLKLNPKIKFNSAYMSNLMQLLFEVIVFEKSINFSNPELDKLQQLATEYWMPKPVRTNGQVYKDFYSATEKLEEYWHKCATNGNVIAVSTQVEKFAKGSVKLQNPLYTLLSTSLHQCIQLSIEQKNAPYEFWVAGAVALAMMKLLVEDDEVQDDPREILLSKQISEILNDHSFDLSRISESPFFVLKVKNTGIGNVFKTINKTINETKSVVDVVLHKSMLHGEKASPSHIRATSGVRISALLEPLVGIFKVLNLNLASNSVEQIIHAALDDATWGNADISNRFFTSISALSLYVEHARTSDLMDFNFLKELESDSNLLDADDEIGTEAEPLSQIGITSSLETPIIQVSTEIDEVEKNNASSDIIFIENADDDELLNSFTNESMKLILEVESILDSFDVSHPYVPFGKLKTIGRAFHTLKGSGLTVGFKQLGATAEAAQFLVDRFLSDERDSIYLSDNTYAAIKAGSVLFLKWITFIREFQFLKASQNEVNSYIELANSIDPKVEAQHAGRESPLVEEVSDENSDGLSLLSGMDLQNDLLSPVDLLEKLKSEYSGGQGKDIIPQDMVMLGILINEVQTGLSQIEIYISLFGSNEFDEETILELSRIVHGLKGALRTCGLMRAGSLLHVLEDDLSVVSLSDFSISRIEAYQYVFDIVSNMIEELKQSMLNLEKTTEPEFISETKVEDSRGQEENHLKDELLETEDVTRVQVAKKRVEISYERPLVRLSEHKKSTQIAAETVNISSKSLEVLSDRAGQAVVLEGRTTGELAGVVKVFNQLSGNIERLNNLMDSLLMQSEIQFSLNVVSSRSGANFDRLEMDHYTALQELVRTMSEHMQDIRASELTLSSAIMGLDSTISKKEQLSLEVQRDIGQLMVVNFKSRTGKFVSILRLACQETKKPNVKLDIEGNVQIPGSMMTKIAPAIDHLLRNCVAHGIEIPQLRSERNKPQAGKITIEVKSTSERLTIEIVDDGAGIDTDKVLSKAIHMGVASFDVTYSDSEIYDMLFSAGLSTADTVSELSGRGVGLESVKATLQEIGGEISVWSSKGVGTKFKLEIPMDIVALSVIPVKSNGYQCMVPSSLVNKIIPIDQGDALKAAESGFIEIDNVRYSYVRFGWLTSDSVDVLNRKRAQLLLCDVNGEAPKAFEVDDIEAGRKVLVRPLSKMISNIPGLIAGTTLSDSVVALIVNPLRMKLIGCNKSGKQSDVATPLIMVVDDSSTVRMVTSRFLRKNGFDVIEASDGLDALECLRTSVPDLFILDVEMPRMDGFELLQSLRSNPKFKDVPIIMVSSRTAQKHRDHAAALGVSGYIGKPFEDIELLTEINKFLKENIVFVSN